MRTGSRVGAEGGGRGGVAGERVTAEGEDQAMAGLFEVQDVLQPGMTRQGVGLC